MVFAALALLTRESEAQGIQRWTPETLIEKSTLVCNGIPTEVVTNGEAGDKEGKPTVGYSATIRVLKVLKGDPKIATITLRYSHVAPQGAVRNSPLEFCLEEGKRYRFYLRESPEGQVYVPCLTGTSADVFSVEAFTGEQADDSKPFTGTEAVNMAEECLKKNRPDIAIEPSATFTFYWLGGCGTGALNPPLWIMTFYSKVPGAAPRNSAEARSGGEVAIIDLSGDGNTAFRNPNK